MFLVLKLPRTGSTMLSRVLDSHPSIRCSGEILNHLRDASQADKLRYLEDYFRGSLDDVHTVLGATINPMKYRLRAEEVRDTLGPGVNVVLLLRNDALRQAVSIYMARDRGTFAPTRTRIKDEHGPDRREFDLDLLETIVAETREKSAAMAEFAAAVSDDVLEISYEDLVTDPAPTYGRVFTHVGAPAPPDGFDYTAGFVKVLPDELPAVVSNFDELRARPGLADLVG